jgi:MYXO-CTERM domain-containing protein
LPIGGDIAAGLQQLADTLQSEACQPATPAPPAQNPQTPPASYQPPQTPAPPAAQPPVEQAVYPGYAPTGAEEVDEGPSPAAIGLALAVLAGGAVWTRRRWRAAHH